MDNINSSSERAVPTAVLSFDVDGETGWISRDLANMSNPGMLSQGAYGPKVGVPRILSLLEQKGLLATFFIPGWIAEKYPEMVGDIQSKGHEIGHHGYLHERNNPLLPHAEFDVLMRGIKALEEVTGERPKGYRAPFWELTPSSLDMLIQEGFEYSSNLMDADCPYVHQSNLGRLVELPVGWMFDDGTYYQYPIPGKNLATNEDALIITLGEFDGLIEVGGVPIFTFHPAITGRPYRMRYLEGIIDHVLAAGAEFRTCTQVASDVTSPASAV